VKEQDGRGKRPEAPTKEQARVGEINKRKPLINVWDFVDVYRRRFMHTYNEDFIKKVGIKIKTLIHEKGTARDKLIIDLLSKSHELYLRKTHRGFQQFRSTIESMTDDKIREEIRILEEMVLILPAISKSA
jgi:hypothetical protein